MTAALAIAELLPATYVPHPFHTSPRAFSETNCYVDLWIGIVHALGLEAAACLGFGLGSAFEGDQWTFVKPAHGDLERLYGVGVEELSLWRSVLDHAHEQVGLGRIPLVEMDAYFLPDTQGTDYRRAHVKTTVGITQLDRDRRRMRYFHNAGFFELEGADFDGLFRLDRATPDDYLPPYCELVKLERMTSRPSDELRHVARVLSRHHFDKRPTHNPIARYAERMSEHMEWIVAGDEATFHRYSFSSLRQLGSAFEVLAEHLRWLDGGVAGNAAQAAEAFDVIAAIAKRLILKLARVANSKRPSDLSASFVEMASAWDRGMEKVGRELDR